jgi:ubiquinone/menaquinone biosynthesis C-methylase UbiE
MTDPKELIGWISGGSVLDVATGVGGFIHFLVAGLKDYREIIGIDTAERAAAAFAQTFKDTPAVRFEPTDVLNMGFPSASFDTVSIANSLHHFDAPQVVLSETLRVLRPGGYFILSEMYCDGQTETQMTHVHLHHWWAAVDRFYGVVHHETYTRDHLVSMIVSLGLEDLMLHDLSDTDEDPRSAETLSSLEPVIDRYIQRAEGHPALQAHGEELRLRLHQVGFHGAASLFAVGKKPGASF